MSATENIMNSTPDNNNSTSEQSSGTLTPSPTSKKHSLFWFRKGLRLHDNPALIAAIQGAATYRCVYILDPWFAGASQVGISKWRYVSIQGAI
ncbi:hypothetical protein RRG08_021172 [Elysia crispata]|uniref:Photolyase/cryptochrome alpha/beta domain-containing protein n=1 Tax=Elysia crispata TaxID=231223 RepID=A0AAE1DAK0_9GAST|nr:hypothetical protein RRG08_021172 [Elysia crispata]